MSLIFSIWTIVAMVVFLGIVAWAFWPRRKEELEAVARTILEDDGEKPDDA